LGRARWQRRPGAARCAHGCWLLLCCGGGPLELWLRRYGLDARRMRPGRHVGAGRFRCGAEEGNYSSWRMWWLRAGGSGGVEAAAEAALGLAVVRRRRLGRFRWHGGSAEAALQRVVAWRQHPGRSGDAEARRWHRCGWQWSGDGAWAGLVARRRNVGGAAAGCGAAAAPGQVRSSGGAVSAPPWLVTARRRRLGRPGGARHVSGSAAARAGAAVALRRVG